MGHAPFVYGGQGPVVMGITWPQCIIAMTLVVLRGFYARTHAGKLRLDFIFVAVGTISALGCQISLTIQCLYGVGRHILDIPIDDVWRALHAMWVSLTLGLISLTLCKLSIVALLLQLTPDIKPKGRFFLWSIGVVNVLINTVQIVLIWLQCRPFPHVWDRAMAGTCNLEVVANDYSYFQGAVAVLTDLCLAIYPSVIVYKLQLSRSTKISFCILMAGGFIPALAGIMRLAYTHRLITGFDIVFNMVPFLSWSDSEQWFIIILGSLPPLRPFFQRVVLGKQKTGRDHTAPSAGDHTAPKTIGSKGIAKYTEDRDLELMAAGEDHALSDIGDEPLEEESEEEIGKAKRLSSKIVVTEHR